MSAAALVLVCTCGIIALGIRTTTEAPPADGAEMYRMYCASCHGMSGRGDGPMAEYLRVPPTDLTMLARRQGGAFDEDAVSRAIDGRTRIGSHGPADMPVWGDTFSSSLARGGEMVLRERVRAIARHVATLQISERPAP